MISSRKLFGNFHCSIVLSPNCTLLIYNSALFIFIYLQTYFWHGLAPSFARQKNERLGNVFFLLNPPSKFADSPQIVFGDYRKIFLMGNSSLAKTFSTITLSIMYSFVVIRCHYSECRHADCRGA